MKQAAAIRSLPLQADMRLQHHRHRLVVALTAIRGELAHQEDATAAGLNPHSPAADTPTRPVGYSRSADIGSRVD
jgi:hypothetical protein